MSALHLQRLAATVDGRSAPELVLIHGWGMSSAVWAPWLPLLRRHCNVSLVDLPGYGGSLESISEPGPESSPESVDALLEEMLAVLPEAAIYVGYSLGGMLATTIAARFPARVQALVTLASNARFVADDTWPRGMQPATYEQFYRSVAKPAVALKRFSGLQVHGCDREKSLLKYLRENQEPLSETTLSQGLNWLQAMDLRPLVVELTVPALFCFGEHDALVPVQAAEHWPIKSTAVIKGAAHALFLSHPEETAAEVLHFLSEQGLVSPDDQNSALRKKRDVARSFSRAATTYDSVAELQRQVGGHLVEQLPDENGKSQSLLVDLGCGTGYFSEPLRSRFPASRLLGIDLAEGMVGFASRQHPQGEWICGDAENLPLAESSVSLMFSSLTIQWCENIEAVFAEAWRVLEPGGVFAFSTLGPDTLHELRSAWEMVDGHVHVNRFTDWSTVREAITRAGFEVAPQPEQETVVLRYTALRELTGELKGLGAHNINSGRPAGMTGRQRLRSLEQAYDRLRDDDGFLPATYQVWYTVLRKPE